MEKNLLKLEWDKLLDFLFPYLNSELAKNKYKQIVPPFHFEKALFLQEQTSYVWNFLEKGEDFNIPSLKSLKFLFIKARKRGLFLTGELIELKTWLQTLRKLSIYFENSPFSNLYETYKEIKFLESEIDRIVDYEKQNIKDRASYRLYVLRKKIKEVQEFLREKIEKLKDFYFKKGYLQEAIVTQREGRYVLPVKQEYKNKVKGILHGVSQSGATVFIEPASIIPITNELEELYSEEEREINKILKKISQNFFEFEVYFLKTEEKFVEFEFAIAKAKLGRCYRGIFPELKKKGDLEVHSGVHPLLYFKKQQNPEMKLVYNNFFLKQALLITGPNLGGKTVSLKTIGILSLMAQSGFLIPAKSASIPVFSSIFVDLGDEQNILEGESSFSSHLKNLLNIFKEADENSLVLLDEPGKGTSPEEGSAIAGAFITEMIERKAKIVVTTHSQFLKNLALKLKEIEVATVEYDKEKGEPLYILKYGVCGSSSAIMLAKKLGFPEKVLKKAVEFVENKEYWSWQEELEKRIENLKKLEMEYAKKLEELKVKEKKIEEKEEELEKRYYSLLESKIKKIKEEFNRFLSDLKQKPMGYNKAKTAFGELVNRELKGGIFKEEKIEEGEEVWILPLQRSGKVLKVKEKTIEVLVGGLKTEVAKEKVIKTKLKEEPVWVKTRRKEFAPVDSKEALKESMQSVMLRGLTVDDAILEVEKAINQGFLKGVRRIYFVHGHGSGKLRTAIREYLKNHPLIEKFEPAPPHEGGNGVTIAFLFSKT